MVHRSRHDTEEVPRLVRGERRGRTQRTASARGDHPGGQRTNRLGPQDHSQVSTATGSDAGVRPAAKTGQPTRPAQALLLSRSSWATRVDIPDAAHSCLNGPGLPLRRFRRSHPTGKAKSPYALPLCRRYRWIRLFVELSWPSFGSAGFSNSGMMRCASALPSSTPHWSNELICHTVPCVNTLCS